MDGDPKEPTPSEPTTTEPVEPEEPPPPFRPMTHLIIDMERGRASDKAKR